MIRLATREAIGLAEVLPLAEKGVPIDITGWTFALTLVREMGGPDIELGMAATADDEGIWIVDAAGGELQIIILPATIAAFPDTTGDFELFGDLLATRPTDDRELIDDVLITVTEGPTE